jgi:hypothetical protein
MRLRHFCYDKGRLSFPDRSLADLQGAQGSPQSKRPYDSRSMRHVETTLNVVSNDPDGIGERRIHLGVRGPQLLSNRMAILHNAQSMRSQLSIILGPQSQTQMLVSGRRISMCIEDKLVRSRQAAEIASFYNRDAEGNHIDGH